MQPSHWARHVLRTDLGQSCSQRGTTWIQVALLEGLGCARWAQVRHKYDPRWDPSSSSWAQHGTTWPKLGFGAEAAKKEPTVFFQPCEIPLGIIPSGDVIIDNLR
jgi:hypothetical protein